MKQLFNRNYVFSLTPFHFSRQNIRSNYHSKSHVIENLRTCRHFISAALSHGYVLKSGLLLDTFTANCLINCYIKLQKNNQAHQVFDEMLEPNVVSWTSLMAGYIHTDLETGKKIHTHVEILGFRYNLVVCSSLVDMYGKCNEVDGARRVFDLMDYRDVVSGTSMITAYAQNARGHEALQVFREFSCLMGERPNHFMLASVINACSSLGKLNYGKVAHGAVIRGGHEINDVVASALVDMYAKCGCFSYSDKVFRRIPDPLVIPYTSMIVGAAKYGLGQLTLQLFNEMIDKRIKPNHVTFVGVLHACSHSGLIDEGLEHLNSMYRKHGVMPEAKHYICVVDMLGRIGRLDEAYHLAKSISVNPSEGALLWGTLLSACRLQGRVDIAVEATKLLFQCNQEVAGAYVTLSNTYASAGDWENAHSLRSEMKRIGVHKVPGCSWVEIKDSTFVFYSGDLSCERGNEVLSFLKELERRMKERGYVGGSMGLVFVDVEQEAKEEIVSLHSERLALAFGLISIPKGITIRVMKNLRMCKDCHEAFKLISEIIERDFVVRDITRFHHFKAGFCSCKDFW